MGDDKLGNDLKAGDLAVYFSSHLHLGKVVKITEISKTASPNVVYKNLNTGEDNSDWEWLVNI